MKLKLLAGAAACSLIAASAQAEIGFGGWGGLEYDNYDGDAIVHFRGDVLGTYTTQGGLVFGVGYYGDYFLGDGSNGFEEVDNGIYGLVSFGGLSSFGEVTLTYGEIWGAGNLFPEDYFGYDDSTGNSDQTLRVDAVLGDQRFAVSYDFNGDDADFELGYAANYGDWSVAVGYENDVQDLGILVGRQFNDRWAGHFAMLNDLDDDGSSDQYGVTGVFTPSEGLDLAANVAWSNDGFHSAGALVTYEAERFIFKAEFLHHADEESNEVEIGLVVPFGKPQPAHASRFALKEYTGFGLF